MSRKRVLVQAGHVAPRQPGHESQTGTAGEQELVAAIRGKLVRLLNADGRFEAIPQPGWIRPDNIRVDAALFLHADGSGNPAASGFSMGYPDYPVNRKLADMITAEFLKIPGHPPHHQDNYTADMRGYYGFHHVSTPGPEVLVEHGFLTNPRERAWLNTHVGELAAAEYRALLRFFEFDKTEPKPRKFAYRVEEDGQPKEGRTDYPALTVARVARRLKRGDRIILEKL